MKSLQDLLLGGSCKERVGRSPSRCWQQNFEPTKQMGKKKVESYRERREEHQQGAATEHNCPFRQAHDGKRAKIGRRTYA